MFISLTVNTGFYIMLHRVLCSMIFQKNKNLLFLCLKHLASFCAWSIWLACSISAFSGLQIVLTELTARALSWRGNMRSVFHKGWPPSSQAHQQSSRQTCMSTCMCTYTLTLKVIFQDVPQLMRSQLHDFNAKYKHLFLSTLWDEGV